MKRCNSLSHDSSYVSCKFDKRTTPLEHAKRYLRDYGVAGVSNYQMSEGGRNIIGKTVNNFNN